MKYDAGRYYTHDEMKRLLEAWEKQYKEVMALSSIGKTYMGRDIFLITLTLGGRPEKKPGILVDGNLHSRELFGSCAVLYAVSYFLNHYTTDGDVQRVLQEKTLYFIPRINADGAEENLTGPWNYRGSLRKFHEEENGIYAADIDGDGEILKMRIQAENGEWKPCERDPRLMVPRQEGDEGPFYHIFEEGFLRGSESEPLRQARNPYDLDPNREFPFDWSPDTIGETLRPSSGYYPLMECETRALADFVLSHRNISTVVDEHTYFGAYISPMEFCQEFPAPAEDCRLFEKIGAEMAQETGYMSKDIFPKGYVGAARGSFTTWLYYNLGIAAWCNENWNPRILYRKVDAEHPIMSMDVLETAEKQQEHQLNLLKWDDMQNGNRGFVSWHKFMHPQLGEVELGGWKTKFIIDNPPADYVERESEKALRFVCKCVDAAPQLSITDVKCKKNEDGTYKVILSIINTGRFPSYGTRRALEGKQTDSGRAVLTTGGGFCKTEILPEIPGGAVAEVVWNEIEGKAGESFQISVVTKRAGCPQISSVL